MHSYRPPIGRIGMVVATMPCCSRCTTAAHEFLRSPGSAAVILFLMRGPRWNCTVRRRKERAVPLWANTARVLRAWFQELGDRLGEFAFPSARARRLSRHGVSFLLSRLADRAATACPTSVTSGFRRT